MHCLGTPKNMQDEPIYENVLNEIRTFFDQKKDELLQLGLPRIWMDPGIGFGKTLEHNMKIMKTSPFFKMKHGVCFLVLPASHGFITYVTHRNLINAWEDQ